MFRSYKSSRIAIFTFTALVGVGLLAPLLFVIPISFTGQKSFRFPPRSWSLQWYENLFTNPLWSEALINSVLIASIVTVFALIIGTMAALALQRQSGKGNLVLFGLVMAPMILPVVITAIGVYLVFLRWGLTGTLLGFVLSHTVLAIPFVVVSVSTALQSYNPALTYASISLGAGPIKTFFLVTLPLIAPGMAGGALFAFMASFDEVVIAGFLTGPNITTLPVRMFASVYRESDPTVAAASTVVICFVTLVIGIWLLVSPKASKA
jgi:putative spermidine/putrescine transport system permease protein